MSKKQSFWIIVIFLFSLLVSLTISLPARHVLQFIEVPSDLKIQGLQGSITDGRVQIFNYQEFQLQNVGFNIQPLCLLKAGLCYQFQSTDKAMLVNVEVNLLSRHISIRQSQILLDSDIFKNNPQLLVQPTGQFALFIESLTYTQSKITNFVAKVDWLGAGIQGEDQLLGNYNALATQEADGLVVKLSDQDSLLSVQGEIDIKWNGHFDVDLKFESRPTLNKSVISVLDMTTRKSGLNSFTLKSTGKVPSSTLRYLTLFESDV